jgi:hypothetical protein
MGDVALVYLLRRFLQDVLEIGAKGRTGKDLVDEPPRPVSGSDLPGPKRAAVPLDPPRHAPELKIGHG